MPRSRGSSRSRSATRTFKLRARADRIEHLRDGGFAILDYKTGAPPTDEGGATGLVAAAHARRRDPARGAFKDIRRAHRSPTSPMSALRGGDPAGEVKPIEFKDGSRPTRKPTRRWRG